MLEHKAHSPKVSFGQMDRKGEGNIRINNCIVGYYRKRVNSTNVIYWTGVTMNGTEIGPYRQRKEMVKDFISAWNDENEKITVSFEISKAALRLLPAIIAYEADNLFDNEANTAFEELIKYTEREIDCFIRENRGAPFPRDTAIKIRVEDNSFEITKAILQSIKRSLPQY